MTTATFANGFTYGGITVSAEESNVTVQNSGNVEISGEKTYSDINDSTGSDVNTGDVETSTVETTTGETVETSTDETTMPETTVEPTTEKPTTPQPTTVPVTTKPASTKVVAWGKNAAGQFVNGNKKVIKGATMKGIDVSYHNGTINWKKVAASDVDYAIIRCGYGDNIKSQDDKKWAENVAGCEKNNIPYGVYIYSYATSVKQAESEANHVLRLIKGHTLNFPIYYDMEDAVQAKLSKSNRTKIANKFLGIIKNAGYECGIYANLNWWNNYLDSSLGGDKTWRT
ncbi:Glycoside hydrolase, family 25, partial [human gut metagenome]